MLTTVYFDPVIKIKFDDRMKRPISLKEGDERAKDDLYKMTRSVRVTRLFTALRSISECNGTFEKDLACSEP
jgi:hypothetical protein